MGRDICVIIPTVREYECVRSYVANARASGFDLSRLHFILITEDFCDCDAMEAMLDGEGVSGEVYDGSRRARWYAEQGIEDSSHVIPEASHAETSFGLLYMWSNPQFEYGFFIDDDTRPIPDQGYFGRHLSNLHHHGEIETVSSDERWVNVLYQNGTEHGLYPRGYPYSAMHETVETGRTHVEDVVVSQGLWTNVPDLDAVRILMDGDLDGQARTRLTADEFRRNFVAAPGNYLTVCSMNLAFRREVIPAFYQLPMDDNRWNVGRFDDIWSGVFLKRACDVLGKQIISGFPLCEHNKAPRSTFDDLNHEVAGLELNEHLWRIVDGVGGGARTYVDVFEAMAGALADGDWSAYTNGAFLNHVGRYMHDWLDCLDELKRTTSVAANRQI